MCWSCKHPGNNYSDADPKTVTRIYLILPGEAGKQRANFEALKERIERGFSTGLCEKHLANYEAVVIALEEAETNVT